VTEFELFQALRKHFPAQQYALLPQVANGTGSNANRHADAVALGLWPSRGIHLHGFEIKSYRGDWLRELKRPDKAEAIAQYCNFWWIVTDAGVVLEKAEIPELWGWMQYNCKLRSLSQEKKARYRGAISPNIDMIAGILRKAQETATPDAAINEAYNSGFEAGKKEGGSLKKYDQEKLDRLRAELAHFKKVSGIDLENGWHKGEEVGRAVKAVLDGQVAYYHQQLLNTAKKIITELGGSVPVEQ